MNIIELTPIRRRDVLGYACGTCRRVYNLDQKDLAESCCRNACVDCGAAFEPRRHYFGGRCDSCHDVTRVAAEFRRFEKAAKVCESAIGEHEYVYSETHEGYRDGYFSSIDELRDWCDDVGCVPPVYVWSCQPTDFSISAESIVEQALEEHYEDAISMVSNEELERLQAFLDEWCGGQGIRSYHEDYSTAVLLDAPPPTE